MLPGSPVDSLGVKVPGVRNLVVDVGQRPILHLVGSGD